MVICRFVIVSLAAASRTGINPEDKTSAGETETSGRFIGRISCVFFKRRPKS